MREEISPRISDANLVFRLASQNARRDEARRGFFSHYRASLTKTVNQITKSFDQNRYGAHPIKYEAEEKLSAFSKKQNMPSACPISLPSTIKLKK